MIDIYKYPSKNILSEIQEVIITTIFNVLCKYFCLKNLWT